MWIFQIIRIYLDKSRFVGLQYTGNCRTVVVDHCLLFECMEWKQISDSQFPVVFNIKVLFLQIGHKSQSSLSTTSPLASYCNMFYKYDELEALGEEAIMVMLAERLHNMRTIEYVDESQWSIRAKETLEIFTPIAAKLENDKLKAELNDLSLKYL